MTQSERVSEQLKKFFSDLGLSQRQIANRVGVSQQVVQALLNGRAFGKKTAQVWSTEFGFNPAWLITGEGAMLLSEKDDGRVSEKWYSSFTYSRVAGARSCEDGARQVKPLRRESAGEGAEKRLHCRPLQRRAVGKADLEDNLDRYRHHLSRHQIARLHEYVKMYPSLFNVHYLVTSRYSFLTCTTS